MVHKKQIATNRPSLRLVRRNDSDYTSLQVKSFVAAILPFVSVSAMPNSATGWILMRPAVSLDTRLRHPTQRRGHPALGTLYCSICVHCHLFHVHFMNVVSLVELHRLPCISAIRRSDVKALYWLDDNVRSRCQSNGLQLACCCLLLMKQYLQHGLDIIPTRQNAAKVHNHVV